MGETFSLESNEFTAQASVFDTARGELAAALQRLQSSIATEGQCWGGDEPGRQFAETYHPDATKTVHNVQNLIPLLQDTGSQIKNTSDSVGNGDFEFGGYVGKNGNSDGALLPDRSSATSRGNGASTGTASRTAAETPNSAGTVSQTAIGTQNSVTAQPSPGGQAPESVGATPNSTSQVDAQGSTPDFGSADQPGVQGDSPASDTSGDTRDNGAADPAVSSAADVSPATPQMPLPDISAVNGVVGDSLMGTPSGAIDHAGARSPENSSSFQRPPTGPSGGPPSRNSWLGPGKRKPDDKGKKRRKEPAKVAAPDDADRPPRGDSALLGAPASAEPSTSRIRHATPWSRRHASEPLSSTHPPTKDDAHGPTESG